MTGSSESAAILVAAGTSAFSRAASNCSIFCGSRLQLSRHHQKARSPTTATATRALIRIGHMTGPPLLKNWKIMLASIILVPWSVQLQLIGNPGFKKLVSLPCRQMPVTFDKIRGAAIQDRISGRLLHLHREDISHGVASNGQRHRPLFRFLKGDGGINRLGAITPSPGAADG